MKFIESEGSKKIEKSTDMPRLGLRFSIGGVFFDILE